MSHQLATLAAPLIVGLLRTLLGIQVRGYTATISLMLLPNYQNPLFRLIKNVGLGSTRPKGPRSRFFEVALFTTASDQQIKYTADYHNPTRQRGTFPNTASNAKAQSLADAAGWDSRKHSTSKQPLRVWGLCRVTRIATKFEETTFDDVDTGERIARPP